MCDFANESESYRDKNGEVYRRLPNDKDKKVELII